MSDPIVKARLIRDEGEKLVVYVDTRNNATGGIGHRILPADHLWPGEAISQDLCDAWFEIDYAAALKAASAYPWYADLDAPRQRLIQCLEFNMGPRTFREFHGTQAMIASGEFDEEVHNAMAAAQDFDTAADRLLASAWAGQVGDKTYESRAQSYARILRTGAWEL